LIDDAFLSDPLVTATFNRMIPSGKSWAIQQGRRGPNQVLLFTIMDSIEGIKMRVLKKKTRSTRESSPPRLPVIQKLSLTIFLKPNPNPFIDRLDGKTNITLDEPSLKMLMFRNPFATSIAVLTLGSISPILHVRAQEGVSYVMSNDGTVQYPCEGAALAEVYYQDKCEFSVSVSFGWFSLVARGVVHGLC
jgi:hypothetical protein